LTPFVAAHRRWSSICLVWVFTTCLIGFSAPIPYFALRLVTLAVIVYFFLA